MNDTQNEYFKQLKLEYKEIDELIETKKAEIDSLRERKKIINRLLAYVGELAGESVPSVRTNGRNVGPNAVLAMIRKQPGLAPKQISEASGVHGSTIAKRLNVLLDAGLVRKEGRNRSARYFVTADGIKYDYDEDGG